MSKIEKLEWALPGKTINSEDVLNGKLLFEVAKKQSEIIDYLNDEDYKNPYEPDFKCGTSSNFNSKEPVSKICEHEWKSGVCYKCGTPEWWYKSPEEVEPQDKPSWEEEFEQWCMNNSDLGIPGREMDVYESLKKLIKSTLQSQKDQLVKEIEEIKKIENREVRKSGNWDLAIGYNEAIDDILALIKKQ